MRLASRSRQGNACHIARRVARCSTFGPTSKPLEFCPPDCPRSAMAEPPVVGLAKVLSKPG
eukprot:10487987-Lingulodinium_polyedra.AAC.1